MYKIGLDFTSNEEVLSSIPTDRLTWFNKGGFAYTTSPNECGPVECLQVNPELLSKKLMEAAIDKEAEVIKGEVVGIKLDGQDNFKAVKLKDGSVLEADAVVLAMGPWLVKVADWFPKDKGLFNFITMQGNVVITDPKPALPADAVSCEYLSHSSEGNLSIYPKPDGTIYGCGYLKEASLPDHPSDVHPDEDTIEELQKHIIMAVPQLQDAKVRTKWSGFMQMGGDFLPIMGKIPSYNGCYIAGGHGWQGILQGPITGLTIATMILGHQPPINPRPYRFGRFNHIFTMIDSFLLSKLELCHHLTSDVSDVGQVGFV